MHLKKSKAKKKVFSRKDEIIRQATIMFKEKGYSGASVRDLAQLAGIRVETLNRIEKSRTTPDFKTIRKLVNAISNHNLAN